jgi:hypothetical protein
MKNKNKFSWKNYTFFLNNETIITPQIISSAINKLSKVVDSHQPAFSLSITSVKNKIINFFDFILLVLAIVFLMHNLMLIFISLINILNNYLNLDIIYCMVNSTNEPVIHNTEVKIIHDDGSWSSGIKTLFIMGTGVFRLHLVKGGTPLTRGFIIASTIATDAAVKIVNNTINDPTYVRSHYTNWNILWKEGGIVEVNLNQDSETTTKVSEIINENSSSLVTNFISDESGLNGISNKILNYIMETLKPILEPIPTNFSNELLASQIHDLSLILFILSILISILITGLLINIFVLINADRITNFFNNKFIRWYVNFNMKLISIEVFFLGSSILYFMFTLSKGLHYIATHPITFS